MGYCWPSCTATRELRNYDTLIIDEAHERSLNIDFILGYLKRLLPSRPELKVIVTSATIDTERFSQHFAGAPVIEVPGRTYPVEIRYRPLDEQDEDGNDDEPMDEVQAVCEAVVGLGREGPGDILVFLPGEREIRDAAEALAKADVRGLEVLSLYGRLSSGEQHKIFEPHTGRRAILSTNVAETSLTVPGIRYVVDLGTGADIALRPADEGTEAANRANIPGLRQPESRSMRALGAWDMRTALLRGGLRRPPALHRAGDIADEPGVGDPSDGCHRPGGH